MFKALTLVILLVLVAITPQTVTASEFQNGRWVETPPKVVLTDWDSLDQLNEFLRLDDTDWVRYPDANGIVWFTPSETNDCDDYAFRLRDRALEQGKWLDTELLTTQEMRQFANYLPDDAAIAGVHLLNKARIGNEVYYIEPQNDKVWLGFYLDNLPAAIQTSKPKLEPELEPEE